MQIDIAEPRQSDHPVRNESAVANDDDRVRLDRFQLAAEFRIILDALWLNNGEQKLDGFLLDWRS